MSVDFGKTAADYARHRAGFPDAFFDRIFSANAVRRNDRVLDLGTGTGTLARGFASRGCEAVGLDRSTASLDEACALDASAGVAVRYVEGLAEALPFADESFDVVCAGQCWHWFDRARAAAEAHRVLVPGGRLILAHLAWIPLPNNVVDDTERLIERHNPQWKMGGGNGIHAYELADVARAGFVDAESFSFDLALIYTQEGWRGRIRASAGVAASLPPEAVAAFDDELAELLRRDFPGEQLSVPHRIWAVIARSPSEPERT
ncbi:MAG: methyltransferase domain-containing protein [Candidatus Eremiobacteraeota bacterium]|nr:methyltransferase domain-containing protein [Candidatus Eremiobacteraeota bacterium]